jgi:hypothetical protein
LMQCMSQFLMLWTASMLVQKALSRRNKGSVVVTAVGRCRGRSWPSAERVPRVVVRYMRADHF